MSDDPNSIYTWWAVNNIVFACSTVEAMEAQYAEISSYGTYNVVEVTNEVLTAIKDANTCDESNDGCYFEGFVCAAIDSNVGGQSV